MLKNVWRFQSTAALALVALVSLSTIAPAAAKSRFVTLQYKDFEEYEVSCAAHLECEVQLGPGEKVKGGFNSDLAAWNPHMIFSGDPRNGIPIAPHFVSMPVRAGLHSNVILTTTKHTYRLAVKSTDSKSATYYHFAYATPSKVTDTMGYLNKYSLATQAGIHGDTGAGADRFKEVVMNDADASRVCRDFRYSWKYDRESPKDRQPHQKVSYANIPDRWVPSLVCNDGAHTFIRFPVLSEKPTDVPIFFAQSPTGDQLINDKYNALTNQVLIDGVYDGFTMVLGSQEQPVRVSINHRLPVPSVKRHRNDPDSSDDTLPAGNKAVLQPLPTPAPIVEPVATPAPQPSAVPAASALPVPVKSGGALQIPFPLNRATAQPSHATSSPADVIIHILNVPRASHLTASHASATRAKLSLKAPHKAKSQAKASNKEYRR